MKVEVFATGRSVKKPVQQAACSIIMESIDEYDRRASRTISIPLGELSTAEAELISAKMAFGSVKRQYLPQTTFHFTEYVNRMLERSENGNFKNKSHKNVDLVSEIRILYFTYGYPKIADYDGEKLQSVNLEASDCAKTQQSKDTDTELLS